MKGLLSPEAELIAELCHLINNPLCAIRNALYLAGHRSQDPALHRYLQMADEEISAIATSLKQARTRVETVARAQVPSARARRRTAFPVAT